MKKFVGFYHYGVLLTYLSAVAGLVGIYLSVTGLPEWGVICLFISGLCDSFDGVVARTRKNRTHEDELFGVQIDSLCDLIAFGVAPAAIGYGLGMHEWYYIIVLCLYSLCALIRLGYFNVRDEIKRYNPEEIDEKVEYFGLPVTCVTVGLPIFYLVATTFTNSLVTELIMCGMYLLVSFLFVFKFKMVKLHIKGTCVTIAIVTALVIALFFVRHAVTDVWFLL